MDAPSIADVGSTEVLLAAPERVEAVIREAIHARQLLLTEPLADSFRGAPGDRYAGYRLERGAALMPVIGTLIPRGPVSATRYGVTSYEALRDELRRASEDQAVSTIVLMIDSPGGYVTGVDATGEAILATRRVKPVVAVVEGMCASAAYWLASQCDLIVAAPFAQLGSIGALQVHVEASRALDAAGIKVTIIRAGARKADANPFEPLVDAARADAQAGVDRIRTAFAAAVVAGRARADLDVAKVLGTEAAMFDADRAVALGLADRIGSLDRFIGGMPSPATLRRAMLEPVAAAPALAVPSAIADVGAAAVLAAEPAIVPPAPPAVIVPPLAPAITAPAGGESERARLGRIMAHPLARIDRQRDFVDNLAFSDMTTEQVLGAFDAVMPLIEQQAARAVPTLAEEMDVDPMVARAATVSSYGGPDPRNMTDAQRGAFAAAQILGKDPNAAAYGRPPDVARPAPIEGASDLGTAGDAQTFRRQL